MDPSANNNCTSHPENVVIRTQTTELPGVKIAKHYSSSTHHGTSWRYRAQPGTKNNRVCSHADYAKFLSHGQMKEYVATVAAYGTTSHA